jgi:uncharacterized membrane protein
MSQTNYADFEPKSADDRVIMHILYGMHCVAWLTGGVSAVVALIVNYVRRSDETDHTFTVHHNYMIHTFWWTLLWLALSSALFLLLILIPGTAAVFSGWAAGISLFLILLVPSLLAGTVIGLWHLYRNIKGWLRFNDNRAPQ